MTENMHIERTLIKLICESTVHYFNEREILTMVIFGLSSL